MVELSNVTTLDELPGKRSQTKRNVLQESQNKDDLCCARAIITIKERVDKGSHYQNLRRGRPIQECWAPLLHQEAGVPEGPCGFKELQKFQDYLGPRGTSSSWLNPQNV